MCRRERNPPPSSSLPCGRRAVAIRANWPFKHIASDTFNVHIPGSHMCAVLESSTGKCEERRDGIQTAQVLSHISWKGALSHGFGGRLSLSLSQPQITPLPAHSASGWSLLSSAGNKVFAFAYGGIGSILVRWCGEGCQIVWREAKFAINLKKHSNPPLTERTDALASSANKPKKRN